MERHQVRDYVDIASLVDAGYGIGALLEMAFREAPYLVVPHPSSITSPPPRVAARPVPLTRTRLLPVPETFLARLEGFAALPSAACGDSVGILKVAAGA
jgi:hypothetical protein